MNIQKIFLVSFVFLFILATPIAKAQKIESKESEEVFEFVIHPQIPPMKFKLIWRSDWHVVERIEIYKSDQSDPIQILQSRMDAEPYQNSNYFQPEDINFDGYKDIKLLIWWGVTGNEGYDFWLFDPNAEKFIFNSQLSKAGNPRPNEKTKELVNSWVGGMAGKVYGKETYKFIEGKLILIKEEHQDWVQEKKHLLKTIKEMVNGEMVIVNQEIIPSEETK